VRAIITYHSIDSSQSAISTSEQEFRRHIEWLSAGHVKVLSLDALLGTPDSDDAVALTFDDAFENFRAVAAPLLRERGFPATLFVATAHAGSTNAWGVPSGAGRIPVLPLLDWDGIAEISAHGISIGSHARTHRRLTYLTLPELHEEIVSSLEEIESHTGIAPRSFAYPYGAVTSRETGEVAKVYDLAVSTELKSLSDTSDRHRLPRIDAYYLRSPGILESFGSARFRRFLKIRNRARQLRASVDSLLGHGGG
jgi:peptidoglycan/xylan/chitin deacetylase (PgdA/CDA1 family)